MCRYCRSTEPRPPDNAEGVIPLQDVLPHIYVKKQMASSSSAWVELQFILVHRSCRLRWLTLHESFAFRPIMKIAATALAFALSILADTERDVTRCPESTVRVIGTWRKWSHFASLLPQEGMALVVPI